MWPWNKRDICTVLLMEVGQLTERVESLQRRVDTLSWDEGRLRALEAHHNKLADELMFYREMAAFGELPGQKDDAA